MHHADDVAVLLVAAVEIMYAFGNLFISCELGQRVNLAFDECNEMVNQFDWYRFTMEIQRMLPTILNYTQQPVDIKCFGSATCDRETFKYVSTNLEFGLFFNFLIAFFGYLNIF